MPENLTPEPSNHKTSRSRSQSRKNSSSGKHLRLERLMLQNFKAFDELTIDFPSPMMTNDPDIFVMGSKNGIGKTSILEACALLSLAASSQKELSSLVSIPNPLDATIRAGTSEVRISGTFTIDAKAADITVILSRDNNMPIGLSIGGDTSVIRELQSIKSIATTVGAGSRLLYLLQGNSNEPFILPFLMYFHSYRKVQEGRVEPGTIIESGSAPTRSRYGQERETPISIFKQEMLRALMGRGSLFANFDTKDAENVLNRLNSLMEQYAGGRIEKLHQSIDGIEFLVTPINDTAPFNFDGLSSGQKEIISTLFLIWYYTREQPGIVLIDEPELHLNPEWHRGFIRHLYQLSPQNQYIIATHSEDVFSAVDKDRRILLLPDVEEVR